jgi:2-oxoisovalerate ferredoxin oxidoreductase beta subunit
MSNELISQYAVSHAKPTSFYESYERKEELRHQTHYCPGCGHGNVHKMLAMAIDELGIQDRTILIIPVGCSVFAYYYFDVGNVQAAHGRAPAVATGVKRSRPESIVIGYQGDGDLSAIGSAEILHAANRGEHITVIFVNNAIYSMTGGQAAPTTLIGQKSTTTPGGRNAETEGYPLHVCELLATLEAPVYIERVGLGDNKQIAQASRAIKRAVENQVRGLGFSLIEVLSPCPTIWKMSPVEAQHWVREVMEKTYPLGVFRDRTKEAVSRPLPEPPPALTQIPKILGVDSESSPEQVAEKLDPTGLLERFVKGHDISRAASAAKSARALSPAEDLSGLVAGAEPCSETPEANAPAAKREAAEVNLGVRVAGFGGQGVLLLGEVLAEAGLDAGLEVSWLPSYGPEMRSGTSNCHVRLSSHTIDSPLVTAPDVLVAMNEPSLRKFDVSVPPGGWVIFNGDAFPEDCIRPDVHVLALPFTHIADQLGDARACNMVMLGALLEIANALPQSSIDAALRRLVKHKRWVDLDERALVRGRELYRNSLRESTHELAYES